VFRRTSTTIITEARKTWTSRRPGWEACGGARDEDTEPESYLYIFVYFDRFNSVMPARGSIKA